MKQNYRPLRRPLVLALAAVLAGPAIALAQSDNTSESSNEQQSAEQTLDRVTVVGSRIKRSEVEGPAPVTVISRADIDREGLPDGW